MPARLALAASVLLLAGSGTALAALQDLPPGGRVDDDLAAGIDPAGDVPPAGNDANVVGGALVADKPRVPWAIFAHETPGSPAQIFVRAFKAGAWSTQGHDTVGGLPSPKAAVSSLNFDPSAGADAPSLDFAGAGRTVPWATWSEGGRIFASRFHPPTDAAHPDAWEFSGPNRAATGPPLPALNIHTDRAAHDPAVAGGSLGDPTAPGPWIAWIESGAHDPGTGVDQLYAVRPSAPGQATCDPSAFKLGDAAARTAALGGFCFGQVGVERLGGDPSLNVDRTRAAANPDIAFAGAGDGVPWVVWRETGASHAGAGLHDNSMVFAAKGVAPGTPPPTGTVDGGLTWVVVGAGAQGVQDAGPGGGSCAADVFHEEDCSVNVNLGGDAGPPRIAAGTMTAGSPTVPWIAWEEGAEQSVIVARLVGTGADARFELANHGRAVGHGLQPDITFSGHTPYVSFVTPAGVVTGHFMSPDVFVKDNTSEGPTLTGDSRSSLSSACTADPFTADGSACQAGAFGTPFTLLLDEGVGTPGLRATGYQPAVPAAETASGVSEDGAAVSATVDPQGAAVGAQFEYGPTTAYGSVTASQTIGPDGGPRPLGAMLAGLPAGTTIHYRAVVRSDLSTAAATDQTFTTSLAPEPPPAAPPADPPPGGAPPAGPPPGSAPSPTPHPPAPVVTLRSRLTRRRLSITVGADQRVTVLTQAKLKGTVHGRTRTLSVGRHTTRIAAGRPRTIRVTLSHAAERALRTWRHARIVVTVTATGAAGAPVAPVARRQAIAINGAG